MIFCLGFESTFHLLTLFVICAHAAQIMSIDIHINHFKIFIPFNFVHLGIIARKVTYILYVVLIWTHIFSAQLVLWSVFEFTAMIY